ncbi:MAG: sigma-70 family RNA polymerase sigma factor [Vicinamibacteraceae bacterium]
MSSRSVDAAREDHELMTTMHSTNGDALAALFRRYVGMVHRVAFDILRDTGEAEDVAQEVFLEIYRRSHVYDSARGSVRGWLFQYAYHRSLRRKEALRRRAAYGTEPLDEVDAATQDHVLDLTRQERRWVIRAGLAQLPERQRITLELACLEELSLRDVAERLSVPLGCVRHYYYRGLSRLRAWALVSGVGRAGGTGGSRAVGGSDLPSFRRKGGDAVNEIGYSP